MHLDHTSTDAISIQHADAISPYVIVCEHASYFIPPEYNGLGLSPQLIKSHIGWDIHAADVATQIAKILDAPLVTAPTSRLVTDLNRPEACQDCIPVCSETTIIPGNTNLSLKEREDRLSRWHRPFHKKLGAFLDARNQRGFMTFLVGIHSFTPVYDGVVRPWSAGVLYRASQSYGETVAQNMRNLTGETIGCNQPYDLWSHSNHTIPFHGDKRCLNAIIVEIRNDLLMTFAEISRWADITSQALLKAQGSFVQCYNSDKAHQV